MLHTLPVLYFSSKIYDEELLYAEDILENLVYIISSNLEKNISFLLTDIILLYKIFFSSVCCCIKLHLFILLYLKRNLS